MRWWTISLLVLPSLWSLNIKSNLFWFEGLIKSKNYFTQPVVSGPKSKNNDSNSFTDSKKDNVINDNTDTKFFIDYFNKYIELLKKSTLNSFSKDILEVKI